ncbi:LacI family transcriptional regulator [Haloactinopolyspora alba]|uniref:LacI family transcriptional regulator n=1 Tax=Haloactinopolyspora alba TaxID=648780 RepID=A0A2P8E9P0_9ACTN|nr:LacI family DNA-binding transcriptional regulator [Haloactinopolyspora alba]PSL06147.1 LacI family transcriptional regulator [Haloactinopolyspora alba]
MSQNHRPTIHEVAKVAGVSISSVSRALNGNTSNTEMVERVNDAVRQVGYVPSVVAQSLKTRHTGQIAFAMEDIGNAAYLAMVREIQPTLRDVGYRLLLHSTGADVEDELGVLDSLSQNYVDGLVLCPLRVTERHVAALRDTPVPVVVIGLLPDDVPVDNVRADSRVGAGMAVEHLYEAGARRIGFIDGPVDTVPGHARYEGYRRGLDACGLPFDEELVEFADFQFEGGRHGARSLLARTDVDAILGANDLIAVGALHVLRELGRSVPDDVRVIGMDDTTVAATGFPPMSSVSLGSADRGRIAAQLLLRRLDGDTSPPERVTVPPSLTIRESTL